ncbi:MAG: hypothetical protein LBC84_06640 [Prevotellaceae bacterium]|jgi:hypothetical protein|nr:hypothetical protein [Prevotellaceae bacterium]
MKSTIFFFLLLLNLSAFGQKRVDEVAKFAHFILALNDYSKYTPQEKVYLHFDNTSYYQGDPIWFACYITNGQHQLNNLSKTLYVELLNPGGEIIDQRILKVENGTCHGDFKLNHIPFYSGFYEVRAYTKYMLNFGDDMVFSRLLPVFNKPKNEGDFEEKKMLNYGRWGVGDYPMKRARPQREKAVNLRFFPEGGNMVLGVASRVAFEATDEVGNPIEVTGVVLDNTRQKISAFNSTHEGRGLFAYTPEANTNRQSSIVEVDYSGKKYRFNLPVPLPQGIVMEIDNLSQPDSIAVTLRKNSHTPSDIFGIAILHGGKLQNYLFAHIADENEVSFLMDKTMLPAGVSQIVLYNSIGEVVCDRLIFTSKNDNRLEIRAKTDKSAYRPFELVTMELSVTNKEANPVPVTFSLSVRDTENEVLSRRNILTDLLLMSEIKGYVRDPYYYFEDDDDFRLSTLDILLMVQGWRRYSWKQMAGIDLFEPKYLAEQGIETNGQIVSLVRQKPQSNVDVDMLLMQKTETDIENDSFIQTFVTDNQGRFSFVSDVEGRWNMILSVSEKGKKKDHRILLERLFSPEPRRYDYPELQVQISQKTNTHLIHEESSELLEDDLRPLFIADSLAKLRMTEKAHLLPEVRVRAKRRTEADDIFRSRTTSIAYYDLATEMDNIYDRGIFVGKDIHAVLKNMNNDFYTIIGKDQEEYILYKFKMPLFVINYERTQANRLEMQKYKNIPLNAIKSIYINETLNARCRYADIRLSCLAVEGLFSCVVFIETLPDDQILVEGAKGVRKTWLDGYSSVSEFYSPDYTVLPTISDDYRRTLYWNPAVVTDEYGNAKVGFYNNSRCTNFSISAETVTSQGTIGEYVLAQYCASHLLDQ